MRFLLALLLCLALHAETLEWDPAPGTIPGTVYLVHTITTTNTSYVLTNLPPGLFWFAVQATNELGVSGLSEILEWEKIPVVVITNAPSSAVITNVTFGRTLTLSDQWTNVRPYWTEVAGATKYILNVSPSVNGVSAFDAGTNTSYRLPAVRIGVTLLWVTIDKSGPAENVWTINR
jgi:hypothetical protein